MARVTSRTNLAELKARVGSAKGRGKDGPARLVRSVQQSLRVEGYEVREEVLGFVASAEYRAAVTNWW